MKLLNAPHIEGEQAKQTEPKLPNNPNRKRPKGPRIDSSDVYLSVSKQIISNPNATFR
jgi:hypothetical protein